MRTLSLCAIATTLMFGLQVGSWGSSQQAPTPPAAAPTSTDMPTVAPMKPETLVAQPIEPFLSSPLAVSEVSASSATLQLVTTIDLACVVVFGTDDGFGRLALDDNMGASAHRDHRVGMRGLEPDTVYYYRLQGSAPDGTLYASATMTFRTPTADAADGPAGVNVAASTRGGSVTAVSSEFSAAFGGLHAIDEEPDTEWSSKGDGDAAFITVTLPSVVTVTGFGMWTRTMGSSAQIRSFEVVNEVGERFGPFELPDASGIHRFAATGTGQSFTFEVVDSSGGNTGAVEVEVFAQPQ